MDYIIAFIILVLSVVGFAYILNNIIEWFKDRTDKIEEEREYNEKEFISKIAVETGYKIYDRYLRKIEKDIEEIQHKLNNRAIAKVNNDIK
jgi:F0F1-type ATP synthase membrane subunit b/b'